MDRKPLGKRSYGSIPHLPGSRLGDGDHTCHEGQARIATAKARDRHDFVIVQEKLDGSNVGVAKINGEIIPITRAGYVADTSPFLQHKLFYRWALDTINKRKFDCLLRDGERLCGEWMAQAHGLLYTKLTSPLLAFDIMAGDVRVPWEEYKYRIERSGIEYIPDLHTGMPMSVDDAINSMGVHGWWGSVELPEGAVWRVERNGKVDFLVKFVRQSKVDGKYLPEISGKDAVWNWSL